MAITAPPNSERALRIIDALSPLTDAGLSIHALTAGYGSELIARIRRAVSPAQFDQLTRGASSPRHPADWFEIHGSAKAAIRILQE